MAFTLNVASIITPVAVVLIVVVLATKTVCKLMLMWFFSRLAPARRRDVIKLVRANRSRAHR